ncbi:hypothetical protein J4E86_006015 [Alternaria arbusti]|uniref:uncharacterized protein n=1 Tax=Alternaria arbusti TaxID=232088 RepID=UPI002220AA45|nr:uncharacterized protein J4E86_006015 [Alternaria arbusti]KAI4954705.1 hypothetical protein J4E86_006015 [Alternaria arbusti]
MPRRVVDRYFPNIRQHVRTKAKVIASRARRATEIAQGWKSTGTFPFGRLPRELRDCIYTYALGPLPTIFKTKGLIVQATHKVRLFEDDGNDDHFDIRYDDILPAFNWGIPKWVLTSKQICSEALSCFSSSRTFNAVDINRVCQFQGECDIIASLHDSFTTPLVFNSEVLRNITIVREYDQYMGIEDEFMAILNRAHVKDVTMELEWQVSRFRDSEDWEEHLDAWIAEWHTKQWDGSLRKVKITIPTNWTSKNPIFDTVRFEQVEALARRLVGQDGIATWGDFHYGGKFSLLGRKVASRDMFKRSLVVERDN